jgi:hypothetical protein
MGNIISVNIIRAVFLFFLQVLVLQAFSYGWINDYFYINIMLYPLIIILLPMRTPQLAVLFIGFGLGILTDMFYDSPGVHASASVATAFLRPWVLGQIEPREGYQLNVGPTRQRFGFPWFSQYAAILLAFHLLVYFAVETFALAYIPRILAKTFYTFIWSIIAVFLFVSIWNTKD